MNKTYDIEPKNSTKLNSYSKLSGLKKNKIVNDAIAEYIDSRTTKNK